ncbi:hypothetical protein FEK35_00575 [Nocardia cyriacigeorgica]|uniref:Uncharacterized protein n=1 Tax=Nocardia cyriacigeorgica TaxID=135487 RepID=A0A5R8PLL0_9NOCA|nr:hypothetical protein [Nocardia cyriacigeorgica]TLG17702.1 hypothetical protein FEK35_00575 [Nocardia cyriacigeorgica]
MPSDVTTGLFTLAGALIGGGGTLLVTLVTTRNQKELAITARDHHLRDRQYAEHRDHVVRLDRFDEAARALADAMSERADEDRLARLHAEYLDTWTKFTEGHGGPELAGPAELREPLKQLYEAMCTYSNHVDSWWAAGVRTTRREALSNTCTELRNKMLAKRDEYVEHSAKISNGIAVR